MPGFGSGFQRSAREVKKGLEPLLKLLVLGLVITTISSAFATLHIPTSINLSGFYSSLLVIVEFASIISTAATIIKMPY